MKKCPTPLFHFIIRAGYSTGQAPGETIGILARIVVIAVSVPVLGFIPGFALLNSTSSLSIDLDNAERYVLMVAVSTATTALLTLLLAELGYLRLWILVPLVALISAGYWAFGRYKARLYPRQKPQVLQLLILGFLLALAAGLFMQPGEWMTGSDPGIYYNTGNHVGQTGSIVIDDARLRQLEPGAKAILTRGTRVFLAFSATAGPGKVRPSFYHILPAMMGLFIKIFGSRGAFYVNSFFAVLSVLMIYLVGRRLAGTFGGLAAALLACFASLEIYFARIPVSEVIEQFFAVGALLVLVLYFKHRNRVYPLLLGLFIAGAIVSRVEGLLFLAAIVIAFAVRMLMGRFESIDRWMMNAAFLAAIVSLLYNRVFVKDYFYSRVSDAFHGFKLYTWISARVDIVFLGIGLIVVAAVLVNLKWFTRQVARLGHGASRVVLHGRTTPVNLWRALAAGVSLLLFIYLYLRFVLNQVFTGDNANFAQFTWMLGGLFIFIAVAGLSVMLYRSNPEISAYVFAVAVLGSLLFFFLQTSNGFVPWSLRRHISYLMPLLFLGAGSLAGLFWMARKKVWKGAAVAVVVALLISFAPMSHLVLQDTVFANTKAEFDHIASITPDARVITPDTVVATMFATPLRYSYNKDCYWLQSASDPRQLQAVVAKSASDGKKTVFMVLRGRQSLYEYVPWVRFTNTGTSFSFMWRAIRETRGAAPRAWTGRTWSPGSRGGMIVDFYDVVPSAPIDGTGNRSVEFNGDDLKAGYGKNLVDGVWVRGDATSLLEDPALLRQQKYSDTVSTIKVPVKAGAEPITVDIDASLAKPPTSALRVIAGGKELKVTRSVSGKAAHYSFVIQTENQSADFQELLLLAPRLSKSTRSSGIMVTKVRASFL